MLDTRRYFAAAPFNVYPELLKRGKLLSGLALAPIQTVRWRRFIRSQRILSEIASASSALLSRIYKPYLVNGLSCAERVDFLMAHYRLALDAGLGNLLRRASIQPLPIADFSGKSGTHYQLTLSAADPHRLDGELVLRLKTGSACIYTASFSLVEKEGKPFIKLGGLHGFLAIDDILCIKKITRDFFGERPANLMLAALREIGCRLGCTQLILTANAHRLPSTEKWICAKSSNYDRIWKEMNAVPRHDGDFELPCATGLLLSAHRSESGAHTRISLSQREVFCCGIVNAAGRHFSREKPGKTAAEQAAGLPA